MVWSACSGTKVSLVIHLNSTHGRIKLYGNGCFVTSYYFNSFVIFLKIILRSDKSYAKKKGFNIMFTVNGRRKWRSWKWKGSILRKWRHQKWHLWGWKKRWTIYCKLIFLHCNKTWFIYLTERLHITALFTKLPASRFPALPGTIPLFHRSICEAVNGGMASGGHSSHRYFWEWPVTKEPAAS